MADETEQQKPSEQKGPISTSGEDAAFENISAKRNPARAAAELIPTTGGAVSPQNFAQMADLAKHMSNSSFAIPEHLRGNIGACVAIYEMALDWGFSAYRVAALSYVIGDRLAFGGELYLAVINKHGGLTKKLRPEYEGEGGDLRCIIRATFKGEAEPVEYRSPPLKTLHPGYVRIRQSETSNEKSKKTLSYEAGQTLMEKGLAENETLMVSGSQLWEDDREQQMFYFSARGFGRRFCSDVMLGVFGRDELERQHIGFENAKDVSPPAADDRLRERLREAGTTPVGERIADEDEVSDAVAGKGPRHHRTEAGAASRKSGAKGGAKGARQPEAKPKGGKNGKKDDAPKAKADVSRETPLPTTVAEYVAYARAWMKAETDPAELQARWRREMRLRNKCEMTSDERGPLEAYRDKRVEQLQ